MTTRRSLVPTALELSFTDTRPQAQSQLAHIALLRGARLHHKAIAIQVQKYYDSVASEAVPSAFLILLAEENDALLAEENDANSI